MEGKDLSWDFIPDKAGFYVLAVSALDEQGRTARTEMDLYASGSEWVKWQNRNPENIEMVTDRDLYQPGDTAPDHGAVPPREGALSADHLSAKEFWKRESSISKGPLRSSTFP